MPDDLHGCPDDATTRFAELLLRIGAMSEVQLGRVREELRKQRDRTFGEIAVELGFVDDEVINESPKAIETERKEHLPSIVGGAS